MSAPSRRDHLLACSQFTGIVQNNADAITTDLAVAFQFDLPYRTKDGSTTSFVVDTAAVLCTGYYHFFSAIAKRYPHCVAKIFLPEDYSPIILSGIVQDDSRAVTTDIAVEFQFNLPYPTKDGCQTSFIIATGPQVSVTRFLVSR